MGTVTFMKKLLTAGLLVCLCGCASDASGPAAEITASPVPGEDIQEQVTDTGYGISMILPGDFSRKDRENCDFSYSNGKLNILGLCESREYLACIGKDPDMDIHEYAADLYKGMEITEISDDRVAVEDTYQDYYEYQIVFEGDDRFWTVGFIQNDYDEQAIEEIKELALNKTYVNEDLPSERYTYKCKKVRIELPRQFEYASDSNNEELTCGYTAVYIYDYGSAADFRQFGIDQDTDIMDAAVSIQSKMGETGEIIKLDSNKAYYTFVTDDYFLLELIYDYGPGFANVEFLGASSMKDILFDYFLDWASTVN